MIMLSRIGCTMEVLGIKCPLFNSPNQLLSLHQYNKWRSPFIHTEKMQLFMISGKLVMDTVKVFSTLMIVLDFIIV